MNASTPRMPYDLPTTTQWTETMRKTTRNLRFLDILLGTATLLAFVTMPFARADDTGPLVVLNAVGDFVAALAWLVAFVYLMIWMNRACGLVPLLAHRPRPFTSGSIVASFLIPIISFFRPLQIMKAINENLDPNDLPAAHVANPSGGYREPGIVTSAVKPVPDAVVSAWWASYVLASITMVVTGRVSDDMSALATGFEIFDKVATLAVALTTYLVVGQIQARIDERLRRVQALSVAL